MTGPVNITSADDSFNSGLFKNKINAGNKGKTFQLPSRYNYIE